MILFNWRRRNKTFIAALTFLFVLLTFPGFSQGKGKNSKNDLQKQTKQIQGEIEEINKMLRETNASKKNSTVVLVNINMKLEKRIELINAISTELRAINKKIKQNEQESEQIKNNLEKLKREYARMIVFAQRNQDAYSVLMFVFAAESFSQAYARLKYVQQYSEFRKKQAIEIINTQTLLIAKLKELKEQRQEKNELLGIEQTEKNNLSAEKVEQEVVLTELQKKEKELRKELERKKNDAAQLQAEIKKIIEADLRQKAEAARKAEEKRLAIKKAEELKRKTIKDPKSGSAVSGKPGAGKVSTAKPDPVVIPEMSDAAIALSEDFSNNRGKLPWPISKGVVCETYGEHEHPAIKGFMMFNNGLEICSSRGSQARAVFAGEVTSIAISPTGGKLVIIRHGEYLSVYCNLEDILVKTGDKVKVNQPIASVMYDEDEGKTSMNFQIWKGQKTMDPSGWLMSAR